jgi:Putative Flp pilus-assembly TadE/G-like
MRARFRHLRHDERGMSFAFVGIGFFAFLSATTLAIDVGMFMAARNQAQNSADAGAMAGAIALAFNSFTDRTPTGPAVQAAMSGAKANVVIGEQVSIDPPDVTFPNDPFGQPTRVKVWVYRTTARKNPVQTLMGKLFGLNTVDIGATATAEAAPANAETCVKPFTLPDKWIEVDNPPFKEIDPNMSEFNVNKDIYRDATHTDATGYSYDDTGTLLVLKADNGSKPSPSMYQTWSMGGITGSDWYEENISTCNHDVLTIGYKMLAEPGMQMGPTKHGMEDLIAKDPDARWDTGCNCVMRNGVKVGKSDRIVIIPLYDPYKYENGKQNGRNADIYIGNYLGFFIERMQGNEVVGRICPIGGLYVGGAGPTPGAFPVVIRLVE